MKKIVTSIFLFLCLSAYLQTNQNINKTSGTVSNPINQMDNIRFNPLTNQMEVVLQSGVETHALLEVTNVTFSTSSSIGCGGITSVTDIDGNIYPVVEIGDQCWTKENLKTAKYADGSVIPNVTPRLEWMDLTTGAWCNNENSAGNDALYGKLYNWYTVSDPRNVCPAGWHVPTDAEWTILTDFLGGESVAGGKMKTTTGWEAPIPGATNESGFSGLPGDSRYGDGVRFLRSRGRHDDGGTFGTVGSYGFWWSSSEYDTNDAWYRYLVYGYGGAGRDSLNKRDGFSVRCLRD